MNNYTSYYIYEGLSEIIRKKIYYFNSNFKN